MDENEVAAMTWELAITAHNVFPALASPRMSLAPFGRGYTAKFPWEVDEQCAPIDPISSDFPAPMFADVLDAIRCDGVSAGTINAVTEPALHYPYPASTPICDIPVQQSPRSPLNARLSAPSVVPRRGDIIALDVILEATSMLDGAPIVMNVTAPAGTSLLTPSRTTLTAIAGTLRVPVSVRIDALPEDDLVIALAAGDDHFGVRSTLPYRFGRPEPSLVIPERSTRRVMLRDRVLQGAIPIRPRR